MRKSIYDSTYADFLERKSRRNRLSPQGFYFLIEFFLKNEILSSDKVIPTFNSIIFQEENGKAETVPRECIVGILPQRFLMTDENKNKFPATRIFIITDILFPKIREYVCCTK